MSKKSTFFNKNLYGLLDWFIPLSNPHSESNEDILRKQRLLVGFALFYGLLIVISSILFPIVLNEFSPRAIMLVTFFLVLGIYYLSLPFILKITNAYRAVAIAYLLAVKISMIFLIFETGGIASPNLIWLAMGALLTIIFLDTRASLVSLVFDVFCIVFRNSLNIPLLDRLPIFTH